MLFLLGGFLNRPVKIGARDEIWQANHGDKVHIGFAVVIESYGVILPPKTFERRDDVFVEAGNLIGSFVAHFEGEGNSIKQADGLFIFTIFEIRVAVATNGKITHCWNFDEMRSLGWEVKLFVFFFEIKCHNKFSITYGGVVILTF